MEKINEERLREITKEMEREYELATVKLLLESAQDLLQVATGQTKRKVKEKIAKRAMQKLGVK